MCACCSFTERDQLSTPHVAPHKTIVRLHSCNSERWNERRTPTPTKLRSHSPTSSCASRGQCGITSAHSTAITAFATPHDHERRITPCAGASYRLRRAVASMAERSVLCRVKADNDFDPRGRCNGWLPRKRIPWWPE